jgi:hypothetical protein
MYPAYGHNDTEDDMADRRGPPMNDRERPADLAAVQADDRLLDEIARGGHPTTEELAEILVGWRRAVDTEPIVELVDLDTALAAIRAGARGRRRRWRQWMRNLIRWRRR